MSGSCCNKIEGALKVVITKENDGIKRLLTFGSHAILPLPHSDFPKELCKLRSPKSHCIACGKEAHLGSGLPSMNAGKKSSAFPHLGLTEMLSSSK